MSVNANDPGLLPSDALPFVKRSLARAISTILNRIGARHRESFDWGYGLGRRDGEGDGFRSGVESGRKAGRAERQPEEYDRGRKAGYVEGLEAGKHVLEIVDKRTATQAKPIVDNSLFDAWALPINEALMARVRQEVRSKLPESKWPTDDQWALIFSSVPSTCVVAGAGSGKSTTLVLRILLLHYYLGYELSSLTVVTFTRMSRFDFINKLTQILKLWNIELSPDAAKRLVSTFHSKILTYVRTLPGTDRIVPFEFCGSGTDHALKLLDGDNENTTPFETRLKPGQFDLLNGAYTKLYRENKHFRGLMQILYAHAITLPSLDENSDQAKRQTAKIQEAARRDSACMDAVENAWKGEGLWPMPGVEAKRWHTNIHGLKFQIHGKLEGRNIYVVLDPEGVVDKSYVREGGKTELVREMGTKRTLFRAYCEVPVIWLNGKKKAVAENYIKWLADRATIAPGFDYQLTGELGATNILEAFMGAASFIENLGLEVPATVAAMRFPDSDPDAIFFEALGMFWPAFERYLGEQRPRVMTFNRMFSLFGENSPRNLRMLDDATLRSMSHLMIDEFQDISPQIVSWVRATLLEIRRRGPNLHAGRRAQHSSMLCVGDDWQSIYGWRGSAPKYFIDFQKEFPSPKCLRLMLSANFRSHQHVIDAAEHVVRSVSTIPGKKACANGAAAADPVPVELHDRSDRRMLELASQHYHAGESVMVLCRRGEDLAAAKKTLASLSALDESMPLAKRRLTLLTYHRSKGLEADAVILIGDCVHLANSPYKNQAYIAAGLGNPGDAAPYDNAQREEIMRLAYVAITRAARHCYWCLDVAPGTEGKPKASSQVAKGMPYFKDLRQK